jgi:hypothetical protein
MSVKIQTKNIASAHKEPVARFLQSAQIIMRHPYPSRAASKPPRRNRLGRIIAAQYWMMCWCGALTTRHLHARAEVVDVIGAAETMYLQLREYLQIPRDLILIRDEKGLLGTS